MGTPERIAATAAAIHIEDTGGPGEPVVFLHGFLFDGRQFAAQAAGLAGTHRCITLDFPGQGRSGPSQVGYSTEALTEVMTAVLEGLGAGPVHLVGLSMGGFSSMRIAVRRPDLVRSVTLVNTSAAPHARRKFPKQLALAAVARVAGTGLPPIVSGIEDEMYGHAFRSDPAAAPIREQWRQRWAAADRAALVSTLLGFMRRADFREQVSGIAAPGLIIAGGADASLPPEQSLQLHERIPGSQLVVLRGVGHSSPVEDPAGVTEVLRAFLAG